MILFSFSVSIKDVRIRHHQDSPLVLLRGGKVASAVLSVMVPL